MTYTRDRAEIGRELQRRLGPQGAILNDKLGHEDRQTAAGIRDDEQPSEALTEIERALSKSEFTADERRRIRAHAEIDVLSDLGISRGMES